MKETHASVQMKFCILHPPRQKSFSSGVKLQLTGFGHQDCVLHSPTSNLPTQNTKYLTQQSHETTDTAPSPG